MPGFVAFRSNQDGSLYIQKLSEVLRSYKNGMGETFMFNCQKILSAKLASAIGRLGFENNG